MCLLEEFKESLVSELGNKTAFTIPVLGGIPVADSVVVTWIIMALLVVLSLLLTRKLSVRSPGKVQIALEWAVQFLNNFIKTNIGTHWRPFAPWLGTVALYIGISNLIGILGLTPPTKDISVTTALAIMSMLLIYGSQFRYNGLLGGLKKFAAPMPLLLPINLMEVVIRPLALCMRLFGNILGAYIIMEMLKFVVPVVLPAIFSIYFDLFDGLIQTVVFVFLTTLFTGEGIKDEE
ncbi:MAG: F0F1 ATP synthase subunit A [Oscillospiraceae bacterium]|nr:F0F1 ATP synthase subunit A [Oscillospiraceae bacterium]